MTMIAEKTEHKAGYKKTKLGWIPDNWEVRKINDIAVINPSRSNIDDKSQLVTFLGMADISEDGKILVYNEKQYQEVMSGFTPFQNDDVIVAKITPCFENGKGAVLKNLKNGLGFGSTEFHVIRVGQNTNNKFLFYHFASHQFRKVGEINMTGSAGQKRVPASFIKQFLIPLPPLPEQQKIAEVLSCWDSAIEKTENLINAKTQLKKALMQKLLTGKVRFGEFAGQEWKKVKFGEIFSRVTRKNTENNTNVLTISAQQGLINQEEFYKKRIASKDTSNYILIKKGEFAYNKSYSTGYPMGAIKRLDKYDSGVVSSLYICFETKTKDVCSSFFAHYFEAGMLNQEIQNIAQEGARNHGLLNIGITEFFNTMLKIPPSLEEQQKIAGVLDTCDKEIELLNKQLDALKEQKKGLMQKLLTGQIRVKTA